MSEKFYVVSQVSPDADGYETATVFDNTADGYSNEDAAKDYLTECQTLRPWQTHTVVSADEFADKFDKEPTDESAPEAAPEIGTTTVTTEEGTD